MITWDNHRWVRLRSSLAVLEEMHDHFAAGYSQTPVTSGEKTYAELLARGPEAPPNSYRWSGEGQLRLGTDEIEAILGAAAEIDPQYSVARGAPQPAPRGRIAPVD